MRYVVLHHTGFGDPHFDLMIESAPGSALMTWRATDWPPVTGDTLTRIGDHRRDYLGHEGPISNNRGEVARIAAGECDISSTSSQITVRFEHPTRMLLILRLIDENLWRVVEVDS